MSLHRKIANLLPSRTVAAVRRVGVGIGLQQVIALERAVDDLAEAVQENALLQAGLERRVAEVEMSLIPVLVARDQRNARA